MLNTQKIDDMTFQLQPLAAAGMAMQVTTVSAPKTKGVLSKKIIVAMSALRKSNTLVIRSRLCCSDNAPLTYQQIRCKGYRSTDLPV